MADLEFPVIDREALNKKRVDELRAELASLGYVAVPRDHIRRFGSQASVSARAALQNAGEAGWMDSIRRNVGTSMGMALVNSGAVRIEEVTTDFDARSFRAGVSVLLDDPTFDHPPFWKEKP